MKEPTLLDQYKEACNYPGRLDPEAVHAHLTEYVRALGVKRQIVQLKVGWNIHTEPELRRHVEKIHDDFDRRTGRVRLVRARAASAARDTRAASDASDARDARAAIDASAASDASAAIAASAASDASAASAARAAIDARDTRAARAARAVSAASDASAASAARAAIDARDTRAARAAGAARDARDAIAARAARAAIDARAARAASDASDARDARAAIDASAARDARAARDAIDARDTRAARAASAARDARAAIDARDTRAASDTRAARAASDARDARAARDASAASDARDTRAAIDASDARDTRAAIDASAARDARDAIDARDARDAIDARDARDAIDASAARDARAAIDASDASDARDTRAAIDASDARDAIDASAARDARAAIDARAARAAIDAIDASAARAAIDASDARDASAARALQRFTSWCIHRIWYWWSGEISWLSATHLGAVQLKKETVLAWSKPLFEAYLVGAWILYWTEDTLFWIAKPTVHTETVNGNRRLHNESYAALESDVENLYFWHGVLVPAFVVVRPDWITVEHIDTERNAEVRRVMLERFGLDKYLLTGTVIDSQEEYKLVEKPMADAGTMRALVMKCPTTQAPYVHPVHPDVSTVEEALAWKRGNDDFKNPRKEEFYRHGDVYIVKDSKTETTYRGGLKWER